jgi:hypothetical protein
MSNPCHIEIILAEPEEQVEKASETRVVPKLTTKQMARRRLLAARSAQNNQE